MRKKGTLGSGHIGYLVIIFIDATQLTLFFFKAQGVSFVSV